MKSATSEQNSSEADSERERETLPCANLRKQMEREPKRRTGTQGRKSQIKSVFRLRVCYFILLFL